jgi:hypothetical protein
MANGWPRLACPDGKGPNNYTFHTAAGFTPFFFVHGYHPSSLYTMYWPSTQPSYPSSGAEAEAGEFRHIYHACLEAAHRKLGEDAQRRVKRVATAVSKQPHFKLGDFVRVSAECLPSDPLDSKFSPSFTAPFKVIGHPAPKVTSWTLATLPRGCPRVDRSV